MKRLKPDSQTIEDLLMVSNKLWNNFKEGITEDPFIGKIYLKDSTGEQTTVPVYYLDEFDRQAAIFPLDINKPSSLDNYFIVVNPENSVVPSEKNTYNSIYHELIHLMDLFVTSKSKEKYMKNYSDEADEKYWGHDFEFKAHANEFLESLVNVYDKTIQTEEKDEVLDSLASILEFFGRGGEMTDLAKINMYQIFSEDPVEEGYPYSLTILSNLKHHNPKKWNLFLKMLYSTILEIGEKVKADIKELGEEKKFKKPRKYSPSYCKKTPCKSMGFSQKASCRPFKNCY